AILRHLGESGESRRFAADSRSPIAPLASVDSGHSAGGHRECNCHCAGILARIVRGARFR
ncbi:unnamed protein product, partial [Durusdinium trenchii]